MMTQYEEYLKLPLATVTNIDAEMYVKRWRVITGRSMAPPHPHRHFTYDEFWEAMSLDKDLMERFGPNNVEL